MSKMIRKFSVQLVKESSKKYEVDNIIVSSSKAPKIIREVLNVENWHNEKFGILCLDARHKVIGIHIISEGTVNEAQIYIREIATRALLNNAVNIIIFHNHPSGGLNPSQSDVAITRKIKEALEILNIQLLDHIILGENEESASLAEMGMV